MIHPIRAMFAAFTGAVLAAGATAAAEAEPGYFRFPAIHGKTVVFTAEGDLWRGSIEGGIAQRLTTHPATESFAALSPDGQTIAFSGEYEGSREVYTMPVDGGVPIRRTYEGNGAEVIGWTPGGEVLYRTRRFSTLPNAQLASINLKTGARTLLPLAQASEGVYAGDGSTLIFTRLPFQGSSTKRYMGGTAQNLWRFVDGTEEALPLTPDFPGTSRNPMWWEGRVYFLSDRDGTMNLWSMLPDGSDRKQHTRHHGWDIKNASLSEGRVIYSIGADLRLIELETGEDTSLSFALPSDFDQQRDKWVKDPIEFLTAVHLSPKGDRVVLTARGQIFVAPVKQGRFVQVTHNPSTRHRDGRFLPDGTNLVALSDASGELEFVSLPSNGVGVPNQITTNGQVFRFEGVPSPDGKWLAYHDKDFRLHIWDMEKKRELNVASSNQGGFEDLAWSPDSQWLAYVRSADNGYRQIHLYKPSDEKAVELTDDRVDSYSPAWMPDGKWLYFLSDREIRSLVQSPWGPRQPEPFFDQITKIYHVALQDDLRSPFASEDELHPADAEKKKTGEKEKEEKDKEEGDKQDDSKDESASSESKTESDADEKAVETAAKKEEDKPSVQIAFDGLAARVQEVPVKAGNYGGLSVTDKHLYWLARETSFEGKQHLQQLEITNQDPKPKNFADDIRGYELSLDGKKILIHKGNNLYVVNSDSGAPADLKDDKRVNLADWSFPINPRDEWRQMFTESWRLMRDYFYDRNMHGLSWEAVLQKYLPLVDRVTDRGELSDLMADMMGELSALHIFVRPGDLRDAPDKIPVASLGAELRRDEEALGWRVTHIYKTDPNYPDEVAPLARPGVGIAEGDVLLTINGTSLFSVADPEMLLRKQAGRQVLVSYKQSESGETKQAIIRPISAGQAADLRYTEWEVTRRQEVEKLSNGEIGYVHLRAMGASDIAQWAREYYPVYRKSGLIIDVRHNRGGNIDSWILGKLLRQPWFYWQGRAGAPIWNMHYAFRGHMVVLCNEFTASDGEAFSEGFKRLGLGKVIGTRTWGGEIWLSFSNWLVDKGIASAAEFGVYGPEGEWLIEGHGVDPDMVVDNLPHATFNGKDAQLEAAVKHLQELIEKDPRPIPPAPKYPDKSLKVAGPGGN